MKSVGYDSDDPSSETTDEVVDLGLTEEWLISFDEIQLAHRIGVGGYVKLSLVCQSALRSRGFVGAQVAAVPVLRDLFADMERYTLANTKMKKWL
jgi:hypothetical protein